MALQLRALLSWTVHGTLHVLGERTAQSGLDLTQPVRILGFDLDSTLIRTKSGKRFAVDGNDWTWWSDNVVPHVMADVTRMPNTLVCIFTNQAGVSKGKPPLGQLQRKIDTIVTALLAPAPATPLIVCMATSDDLFRKPALGMWQFVKQHVLNEAATPVDMNASFYCGDAAGRIARWDGKAQTKKDFSGTDLRFARNTGLRFLTPDEYFLGQAPVAAHLLDPTETELPASVQAVLDLGEAVANVEYADTSRQELVILVAAPSSGKSTFAERHFVSHGYVRCNQDTLKTKEKCVRVAKEALTAGKSVVIDNTNASDKTRALYVAVARECPRGSIPVRCIVLDTDIALARHLNMMREVQTRGAHHHVPDIAYNLFKRDYVVPDADREGFAAPVIRAPFQPFFANAAARTLFAQMT
jgi:bifunctional polynucleotide phosphatase/kinase